MLNLSIINPYDPTMNFKPLMPLQLGRGGVFEPKLKMDINEPYQITMKVDMNVGEERWKILRDNFWIGLRLRTETQDIVFVKSRQPQFDVNFGELNLAFVSSVYLLKNSQMRNLNRIYTGSAISLIASLDPRFEFRLIGNDFPLSGFTCGVSSNYDILNQVCEQFGWSWRENGLINVGTESSPVYKTLIDIGIFKEIDSVFAGTQDPRYRTNIIKQTKTMNQPNAFNNSQILINKVKLNYFGESFTHLFCFVDTSSGSGENTIITFTANDVGQSWVQADYPILPAISTVTGKTSYYIVDMKVKLRGEPDRFESLPYTNTTSNQDISGISDIMPFVAKETLYNKGVAYLKAKTGDADYSYDLTIKEIILPSNRCNIRYKETQQVLGGQEQTIFDINESILLRNLTYDLDELA